MQNKSDKEQLTIELDEVIAEGVYSNLVVVNHSMSDFVVDFVNVMPSTPKARVKSRVILTPLHAKRLLRTLEENIENFERSFGKIKEIDPVLPPMMSFDGGDA